MDFLKQLTNPALKRLYKFILKRAIGRFLRDELDLGQLDVHMRAGVIELTNLQLSSEALNEALGSDLPVHIASGFLGRVKVKLCYTNILEESLTIDLDNLTLLMVPNNSGTNDTKSQVDAATTNQHNDGQQTDGQNSPDRKSGDQQAREGLDFLASWIDKIMSKIKIRVSNLAIHLKMKESDDEGLIITIPAADFSDETDGVDITQSMNMQESQAASVLGLGRVQKVVHFSGFNVLHLSKDGA